MATQHWFIRAAAIVNLQAIGDRAFDRGKSAPGRDGLIRQILLALQGSGRRRAEREIERYDHLIQYARTHPLTFDGETDRSEQYLNRPTGSEGVAKALRASSQAFAKAIPLAALDHQDAVITQPRHG